MIFRRANTRRAAVPIRDKATKRLGNNKRATEKGFLVCAGKVGINSPALDRDIEYKKQIITVAMETALLRTSLGPASSPAIEVAKQ
jgi:hypothetical protein